VRVWYSPLYEVNIGPHVFPTSKYRLVHERLVHSALLTSSDSVEPFAATWDELALVHTSEYLTKLRDGTPAPEDVAELELPWSQEMVDGFRLMTGGTIDASCFACGVDRQERSSPRTIRSRIACHIGGGLHHAFPNHGEGFCPFNDIAVAARVLQAHGLSRIAVVDLDVHHGNGTAFIFNPEGLSPTADAGVFTFSMHQQYNYPMWKPRGSIDIGLPDGAGDATFMRELERALPAVMASRPECVFYLAGADPFEEDQLGGLRLTRDGLRLRDRLVIECVRDAGVPLVITLAGGYARRLDDTVAIHTATIEEAIRAEAE